MSNELAAELRLQRDRLRMELERLRSAVESLRSQRADESEIGATVGFTLADQERAFDDAREHNAELAERHARLVAEERALRERIAEVQKRYGR